MVKSTKMLKSVYKILMHLCLPTISNQFSSSRSHWWYMFTISISTKGRILEIKLIFMCFKNFVFVIWHFLKRFNYTVPEFDNEMFIQTMYLKILYVLKSCFSYSSKHLDNSYFTYSKWISITDLFSKHVNTFQLFVSYLL